MAKLQIITNKVHTSKFFVIISFLMAFKAIFTKNIFFPKEVRRHYLNHKLKCVTVNNRQFLHKKREKTFRKVLLTLDSEKSIF